MNKHEKQEWINKIKGKKIKLNTWESTSYFIPNGKYYKNIFYGDTYLKGNDTIFNDWFTIDEGFNKDEDNYKWEVIYD